MIEIDRYHWNLARAFFSLSSLCAVVGIVGNFLIVLATVKTKSLRSTCNILIAICAIGDIFHQGGTLIQLPLLFDIYLEIDSDLCDLIMFLPEMGIAIGGSSILCIGLDRMISVMFPTRYQAINKRLEYLAFLLLMTGYCGYLIAIMILFHKKRLVVCEVVSPYPEHGVEWFNYLNVAVNVTSALVYTVTWIGLRKQADPIMMKKIVKSLFIVVAVDFTGWVLTPGTIIFLHNLDLIEQQLFAWTYLCTIFINISLSVKIFIYYYTSSEYRNTFDTLFRKQSTRKKSSIKSITAFTI